MSCSLDYPCSSTQVSMIVCMQLVLRCTMRIDVRCTKMHYENFTVDNNIVQISGFLWYMFFGALIVPLAWVFTFGIYLFKSIYFFDLLGLSH